MKTTAIKVNPEDYILSVLSPKDRLDAAFKISKEAFKKTKLTMQDIDKAVKSVRRNAYEKNKVIIDIGVLISLNTVLQRGLMS